MLVVLILSNRKSSLGDTAVQDAVRESFHKLLDARFVERCPAPEPFIEPPGESTSVKRGSKAAKVIGDLF